MTYQSLSKVNERYQLTVMWGLMAAFFVAMVMMFVHPTVTLALFWLGLISLGVFAISEHFITSALQRSAKRTLARHACPCCGAGVHRTLIDPDEWSCDRCGAAFADSGRRDS